jgi:integrase
MKGKSHHSYDRGGIVYAYGRIDGKTYRISSGREATKVNLAYVAREWESIIRDKISPKKSTGGVTLEEFGVRALKATEQYRAERTNARYARMLHNQVCPAFGKRRIDDITSLELLEWQGALVKDGGGIDDRRKILNLIFGLAVTEGIIAKNPLANVPKPKKEAKEKEPFTLEEVKLILDTATGWFKNFLTISFYTGMRPGELLGLRWERINFHARRIAIKQQRVEGETGKLKTPSSNRVIEMFPIVERALREQYLETGLANKFIFMTNRGDAYGWLNTIREQWERVLRACLLDYRELYTTRHTFASIALSKGANLLWVSKMLGHKSPTTTLAYYAKYIPQDVTHAPQFLQDFREVTSDYSLNAQNLHRALA